MAPQIFATAHSDPATNLAELPEDCLSRILSWTTALDTCRLACVCRAFAAAARSNVVWENLLPSDYRDFCGKVSSHANKREVFDYLAEGISLEDGRQKYKLLRRSGDICRILSAEGMNIAWGDDTRFWKWEASKVSCFGKVAHLLAVCWLEVTGKWSFTVPPGMYSLLWRLKVANPRGGQVHFLSWKKPLNFCVAFSGGLILEKELNLLQLPCNGFEEWFEFEVGQVEVKGKRGKVKLLHVDFFIRELDCSFWKGGLFLDCLTVRVTHCDENLYVNQSDRILSRVRGRPGVF